MARVVPTAASLRYLSSCLRSQPIPCPTWLNVSRKQGLCFQTTNRKDVLSCYDRRSRLVLKPQVRYASGYGKDAISKEFILDEEIPQRQVCLKNREENTIGAPQPINRVLKSINREKQVVHLLMNDEAQGFAIVEIVDKEVLKARLKSKHEKSAALAKQQRQSKTKQIEVNWAISENDLQLKLRQMRDFLEKGRKVEVLLASKKRQRKATPEEAQNVVKAIRKTMSEMDGVRETKDMEGQIGAQAMLTLQQQQQKPTKKSTEQGAVDKEAD